MQPKLLQVRWCNLWSSVGDHVVRAQQNVLTSTFSRRKGTVVVPAQRTGNMDLPPDDAYTWLKYGRKDIFGSGFPRSYCRCKNYGCKAKKTAHRLDDDPFMYEVTYRGNHTCLYSTTRPLALPATTATATANTNSPIGSVANPCQDLVALAAHPSPVPSSLVGAGSTSAGEGSSAQVNVPTTLEGDNEYLVMNLNSGSIWTPPSSPAHDRRAS